MKLIFLSTLLLWYTVFFALMGIHPVDPRSWALASILPVLFVGVLAGTYRRFAFSSASYVLMTLFLTLHAIGSHYTYAQVPFGLWLEGMLDMPRNHFDRIVHFCFGLFFAYPLYELMGKLKQLSVWLRAYMIFMTLMALAGLWEILESWVARIVRPELGSAFLGAQGDFWDAQKDMAATLYGVLICLAIVIIAQKFSKAQERVPKERMFQLPHASHHCDYRS